MNLNPTQPDPTHLPEDPAMAELVGDALAADASPADLESRVLALTDPSLNALLDEVLGAEELPAGLTDRVLVAALSAAESSRDQRPVLARIGFQALRYTAAAAVVVAAGLGIYVATQTQSVPPGDKPIVKAPETAPSDEFNTYPEFAQVDIDGSFAIDAEIEQLDSRISSINQGIWAGDIDDFEDQLWSELSGEDNL